MTEGKIKVAYILTPVSFGGAEKVALNFLGSVDRSRFDIHLIVLVRPWESPPLFINEAEKLGYGDTLIPIPLSPCGGVWSVFRVAWLLFRALKKGSFDVVHTQGYFADICGLLSARIFGAKCITTCHGFIDSCKRLRIYNLLDRYVIRLCCTVLSVSEAIKHDLVASGLPADRIVVVPNAVQSDHDVAQLSEQRARSRARMEIAPGTFVVGYLGRLSIEKGLVYLLDAFSSIVDRGIDAMLFVVGEGPERTMLEGLVESRGLEDSVCFAGFQADTQPWLAAFDCFVLPSLTEGTPLALLEAMSLRVPVIATSVGGVPGVVQDGVSGFLVLPASSSEIMNKLEALIADPCLADNLANIGQLRVAENYGLESWCSKLEERYVELMI
jgi:glycosyltransferase involved in cell wall biosynthesis